MSRCQNRSHWAAGPLKGNSGYLQSDVLIVLCGHICKSCQCPLSVSRLHLPPSSSLASTIHPMGPGLATGPRVSYSPLSCRSDLESIGSSLSSCPNGFPSFRVNSRGPSACPFPSVYSFLLPDSHRALSLTSFRLLLQRLFLWEACSDHAIKKKVASTAITSCPVFLPLGTSFLVILRAGARSQPLLHPHRLHPCLAHCRYSENYIYWTEIWINIRPFVFINTNPPENVSELSTIMLAEEMSTSREMNHLSIAQWNGTDPKSQPRPAHLQSRCSLFQAVLRDRETRWLACLRPGYWRTTSVDHVLVQLSMFSSTQYRTHRLRVAI